MTNNINPIRLGITGNQYYKKEEKEDLAKDSRKQAQAAPEERKTLETDAVLSYLATKNADILPSKGKKTVDVSKYVNAEQAARIEEFMKAFEDDFNQISGITLEEFPDLSEEAAGDLALTYINTAFNQ